MADAGASLNGTVPTEPVTRITSLSIEGFKSIDAELNLELQPLTILAGANSSGKSSALQPLLLLKQTLEAIYDPGLLLIKGPNVEFTSVSQFLCRARENAEEATFSFGGTTQIQFSSDMKFDSIFKLFFRKKATEPLQLEKQLSRFPKHPHPVELEIKPGITEINNTPFSDLAPPLIFGEGPLYLRAKINRCFIEADLTSEMNPTTNHVFPVTVTGVEIVNAISHVIHVPGLRGNPKRNYPVTAVGDRFPGTFENYVASILAQAQSNKHQAFLTQLETDLRELGLAKYIRAKVVDDSQVELLVNRLPQSSSSDEKNLVSIADVGFGVSHSLPVVVALRIAKPGQLVFIEQPEIHLHPRAQVAMAGLLVRAANRGVQVVIETHSSLLLLGIQRLVADETIDPAKIKLHWFKRNETTGLSEVTSGSLDPAGAFGDWPEDFDDVILSAQQQYLDAAEKKLAP